MRTGHTYRRYAMALLGFLLFAASVATAVSIAASNTDAATFAVFGETVTDLSPGGLMLAGVGLGVVGLLGLWMIAAGVRHSRRRRAASRMVVQESRSRVDELEEENIQLRTAAGRRATTPTAVQATSARGSTAFPTPTDRDDDVAADRAHRPVTPMMATSPEPIDLRATEAPAVYPQETPAGRATDQGATDQGSTDGPPTEYGTPAVETARQQRESRVFGRRNR
ncbi:MAG: hypothetical protein ABIM89_14390 [Mycobacteriales bacterium]